MTKDPIAKMYKHLSTQELALLAFSSLANGDELEQARIADAVPRHTYSCLDAGFTQHLDRVFNMACCWAIQYWQCQTRTIAARAWWLTAKGDALWQADEALYRPRSRAPAAPSPSWPSPGRCSARSATASVAPSSRVAPKSS